MLKEELYLMDAIVKSSLKRDLLELVNLSDKYVDKLSKKKI